MKARIKWVEEVSFIGETESGHSVVMDGPPAGGGRNLGPRPMEMLLIGTGACTAYDVVTILKKGGSKSPIAWWTSSPTAPRPTPKCSPVSTCTLW